MTMSAFNNVRDLIDERAYKHAEHDFLFFPDTKRKLNYQQLQQDLQSTVTKLLRLGLKPGAKIGFMLPNSYAAVVAMLAAMYGGYVSVPLNLRAGHAQCAYVLGHSDVELVFVTQELSQLFQQAMQTLDRPISSILTDPDNGPVWPTQTNLSQTMMNLTVPKSTDPALLIYTSGTTGLPKGVVLTHANVIAGGGNTVLAHALSSTDCGLCVLPLYHINAQMVSVMATLVSAASLVLPPGFSVSQFWSQIIDYECSWCSIVPTIVSYLLKQAQQSQFQLKHSLKPRLRFVRSASAPLAPALQQAFEQQFAVPLIETMGLTETSAQILANPLPPKIRKSGSPGIAYGNEAKVVDAMQQTLLPGQSGELLIRGPNVMQGYYKDSAATQQALTKEGWLFTGDLGYFDQDGYFYVIGRRRELIIKGGENIMPREIDDVLYQHPAVLEAAAVGISDLDYGQEIIACVVLKPGVLILENELLAFCRQHLGAFKTPKSIKFFSELPKGPSGKIQRLQLPDLLI